MEWNNVFYLTTAIYAVGAIFYIIFGSGELQSWARVKVKGQNTDTALRKDENDKEKEKAEMDVLVEHL